MAEGVHNMSYRQPTRYEGVYERILNKTFQGKPNICYDISYKIGNQKKWEKVGKRSEGYDPKLANHVRGERIREIRHTEELPKKKKPSPLFKEIVTKYYKWAEDNKKSYIDDKSRCNNYLLPLFGKKRLSEISTFHLEGLKSKLKKKGLAPKTIAHVLTLFRAIVNKAILWKLWDGQNPIKGLDMPNIANERDRYLSYEQTALLLNELKKVSQKVHDISLIALHTGMRFGEITNLKLQDIEWDNGTINIADPKNKKSRKAYMTPAVKVVLKEIVHKRSDMTRDDFLFLARQGKPITEVSDTFKRVIEKLGFNRGVKDSRQKISFHSLRHTFASMLIKQGENLYTVKELLGHKSLKMTERYAHLCEDSKKQAAAKLARAFKEKHVDSMAVVS
jgi:integrase